MTPAEARRHYDVLEARLKNDTYFGNNHEARALMLQCVRDGIPKALSMLTFDGRGTFHTKRGRWQPKALPWALQLFLTAHCRGAEVCIAGASYGAVHGALNRQVESLYRVDPDLANALAFGHGDAPGLHLRKDNRHPRLFWIRWQAPQGMRLESPVSPA